MYGAGITPLLSTNSANVSSSHLNDSATFGGATGSVQATQSILPRILKTRSLPHLNLFGGVWQGQANLADSL